MRLSVRPWERAKDQDVEGRKAYVGAKIDLRDWSISVNLRGYAYPLRSAAPMHGRPARRAVCLALTSPMPCGWRASR